MAIEVISGLGKSDPHWSRFLAIFNPKLSTLAPSRELNGKVHLVLKMTEKLNATSSAKFRKDEMSNMVTWLACCSWSKKAWGGLRKLEAGSREIS